MPLIRRPFIISPPAFVPQTEVTPKLIITTKSEKQFTYELKGAVTFSSGKVSTANIVLKDDSIYTDFTPTISDWVADKELQFGQDPNGGGNTGGDIPGGDIATSGTIYFHPGVWNVDGAWFSAHFWGNSDADITLTDADGDGVFECPVPEGATGMLFCRMNPQFTSFGWDVTEGETVIEDHVWNQTADLTVGVDPNNHYYVTDWESGEWGTADYVPTIPDTGGNADGATLYLKPNANWSEAGARFAVYMWNSGGDNWVDMTTSDTAGVYQATIPAGFSNIIFCRMNPDTTANNWDNKWNQTADLTVPTDGTNLYTVAEGAWDKGNGSWSVK